MKKYFTIILITVFFYSLFMATCFAIENKCPFAIKRDKNTKAASIEISEDINWELFKGESPDKIDYSNPILKGSEKGIFPIPVTEKSRSYFAVRTKQGDTVIAERLLPITGGYNFRDLGGIKNKEGKSVVWGKLFRADDLKNLTSEDLGYLTAIPITTVADFRTFEERIVAPDKLPASVSQVFIYNIAPGSISVEAFNSIKTPKDAQKLMNTMYQELVSDEKIISSYRDFFDKLQNGKNLPILYHCSAGKDRTGLATALILFSLGVDRETIMEDYLSSSEYLKGKYPSNSDLFTVKAMFLQSSIEHMEKEYGSVENYLIKVLDIDTKKMKELYLK